MITDAHNEVNFSEPLDEDRAVEPYVLIRTDEVTFITNRFHVWSRMIATHPRLAAMSEESKSAHLEIVAHWQQLAKPPRTACLLSLFSQKSNIERLYYS
jgi:hypothetical protein